MSEYIEKEAATMIPVLPKEHREYQTFNLDDAYENGWFDALECVRKLPAADVRPVVRGEWIGDGDCIICSNCKTAYTFIGSNFCPNCGADMMGDKP